MGLELGQIITHIIGFVIAVIVLKKFAWKPILSMLEERRNKIKSEFDSIKEEHKTVLKRIHTRWADLIPEDEHGNQPAARRAP